MAEVGPTVPAEPGGRRAGRGSVLGLLVPADECSPVVLALLRLSVSELSAAVGGGALEEALTAEIAGGGYTFYVDTHRVAKGLAPNERAVALSARLGHVTRAWLADLCGDVLVLGCDARLDDVSVPRFMVEGALRSGLFAPGVGSAR